jgi:protein tyrosine phosphatase (PTP) superfamily phosphohydrolase (DUF442 family)
MTLPPHPSTPGPLPRTRPWSAWRLAFPGILFLILLVLWSRWGNFQTIVPGAVYGSAQPDSASLEHWLAWYHLRAVINLRGANPAEPWYVEERKVVQRHGLPWYDLPLESQVLPAAKEVQALVPVLESCPKPVLLHCQSGIDRTGMAAVVAVLLLDDGGPPARALDQLTWWRGHFPGRPSVAVKRTFVGRYERWLADNGWRHTRARFRDWALTVYRGDGPTAQAGAWW